MGTSGGGGFSVSDANIGHLHVKKEGNNILVYVYIGGNPRDESSWFLIGGRATGLDVTQYSDSQIGGSWFDPSTNETKIYGKVSTSPALPASNQVVSDPIIPTITGVYADVRESLTPSSSALPPGGVWYYDVAGVGPSGGYAGATNIACFTSNPAAVTLSMNSLPSGTYNVWAYIVKSVAGAITASVTQLGRSTSLVVDSTGIMSWQRCSTQLEYTQGTSLTLNCTGFAAGNAIAWRGLYLTTSQFTPSFVPQGNTGYVVFSS